MGKTAWPCLIAGVVFLCNTFICFIKNFKLIILCKTRSSFKFKGALCFPRLPPVVQLVHLMVYKKKKKKVTMHLQLFECASLVGYEAIFMQNLWLLSNILLCFLNFLWFVWKCQFYNRIKSKTIFGGLSCSLSHPLLWLCKILLNRFSNCEWIVTLLNATWKKTTTAQL